MDRRKRRRLLSALQSGILEDIRSISNTAIASFTGDGRDLVRLVIGIDPVQDLHGYNNPWYAGGGKNLFPLPTAAETKNGVTVEATTNGEIWVHGTPTITSGYISFSLPQITSAITGNAATISINEKMVGIGFDTNITGGALSFSMSDTLTVKTAIANAVVGAVAVNVRFDVGTIDKKFKIQLELGTTATAWTPFANICPISGWPESKVYVSPTTDPDDATVYLIDLDGTRYGGTLDVTTGKLTVDRTMLDMSTITDWTVEIGPGRIYKIRSDLAPASAQNVVADGLICNRFKSITADNIFSNMEGVAISSGSALQFHINGLTDDPDITLAMVNTYFANNSTIVVAKLATPIEVQLTPTQITTLSGVTNNIWADTGDIILLEYMA